MSKKKESLVIKGSNKYIEPMYKHLYKEHPSTHHRMKIKGGARK